MRALLAFAALAAAPLLALPSPAAAFDRDQGSMRGPPITVGSGDWRGSDRDFRHDRRRTRGSDTILVYDRGYQGDSAWRANSFNDWWHERTERSYPRWLQNNESCERKWWAGETLRC